MMLPCAAPGAGSKAAVSKAGAIVDFHLAAPCDVIDKFDRPALGIAGIVDQAMSRPSDSRWTRATICARSAAKPDQENPDGPARKVLHAPVREVPARTHHPCLSKHGSWPYRYRQTLSDQHQLGIHSKFQSRRFAAHGAE